MTATLVKWDASIVGETPPIGRWLDWNGQEIRTTTAQPGPWAQRLARLLGRRWVPGVDAAKHPGCIEVIELNEGQLPQTIYRRP